MKLLQECNSELQNEKKKTTVKAKQDREETEHVNEENLRLDQEIEKLEGKLKKSIQYEHKLEEEKLKLENKALQDKIQKAPSLGNQNKKEIESNEENRRQIKALKVENTKIKDILKQHKEIVSALREKKNVEECNINLVKRKHQIQETLKRTENNLNITKQDLEYFFKKNFQQSEPLNEQNYSKEIRILPIK